MVASSLRPALSRSGALPTGIRASRQRLHHTLVEHADTDGRGIPEFATLHNVWGLATLKRELVRAIDWPS